MCNQNWAELESYKAVCEQAETRICRKGLGSNSMLCQFSRCWVYKRSSGFKGKLKEDNNFKCQACENQQTGMVQDCPGKQFSRKGAVSSLCYSKDQDFM